MSALTTMVFCPRANQNLHLLGSRWSCLNPAFPGQEVARRPAHAQGSGQHPRTQPSILIPSTSIRELGWLPGMWPGLLSSYPGCSYFSICRLPCTPCIPRFWSLDGGHVPKPSSSQQACWEASPHPHALMAANRDRSMCYGTEVTPTSHTPSLMAPDLHNNLFGKQACH